MDIDIKDFCVSNGKDFELDKMPTSLGLDKDDCKKCRKMVKENLEELCELQDRLAAAGTEGVVLMIQAMDAAGKDGVIKHVLSGVNPAGIEVVNFKTPSKEELAHDFLWRCHKAIPERGKIGVCNRSWYEDVLVVRVRDIFRTYNAPKRLIDMKKDEFFKRRFMHIRDFETYLYDNGYRIIKLFLNVSQEEQHARFLARIEEPDKNWKFSAGDLSESQLWNEYMEAFEDAIRATSSSKVPWYVIPADQKKVMQYIVSEILLETLRDVDPQYPTVDEEAKAEMLVCRESLIAELGEDSDEGEVLSEY